MTEQEKFVAQSKTNDNFVCKGENRLSDSTLLDSEGLNGFVLRAFVFKACEDSDGSKCSPIIEVD